jgi:uncharacterized protein YabN with tetrapyrrole methylase and pyrophosphatase domain
MSNKKPAIEELLDVMAKLRSPQGCPWDREQDHMSLRFHAVEEVYELLDAIEAGDDPEMVEELGDLLLQVVFHCQLGKERGAFDFEAVCRIVVDKLIRRHPHVFGDVKVMNVDQVWANWDQIKRNEKKGTRHERPSIFDGIPKHLPALLRAEKLHKKARKADLGGDQIPRTRDESSKTKLAGELFRIVALCQRKGWSAEELLRQEVFKVERQLRRRERQRDVEEPVANALLSSERSKRFRKASHGRRTAAQK